MGRDLIIRAAAVLAIPAAIVLMILGLDVMRLPDELAAHDSRFSAAPERQAGLWSSLGFLPGDPAATLVEVGDDLDYRRTAGLYLRAEPGKVDFRGFPKLEAVRAKAEFELTRRSHAHPDPKRRAQLLVLYGVMKLDARTNVSEERDKIVATAADAFRRALDIDPGNLDAKVNLEMVLRIYGTAAVPSNKASLARQGGQISGQGQPGGGY